MTSRLSRYHPSPNRMSVRFRPQRRLACRNVLKWRRLMRSLWVKGAAAGCICSRRMHTMYTFHQHAMARADHALVVNVLTGAAALNRSTPAIHHVHSRLSSSGACTTSSRRLRHATDITRMLRSTGSRYRMHDSTIHSDIIRLYTVHLAYAQTFHDTTVRCVVTCVVQQRSCPADCKQCSLPMHADPPHLGSGASAPVPAHVPGEPQAKPHC